MYNNVRLFNVLTRHQIYVEGVKAQHAREFNEVLRELQIEFNKLFARLRFKTLDGLTKAALRSFLIDLRDVQGRVYNAYTTKLIAQMQDFMRADIRVSKVIFATLQKVEGEDETPVTEDEADAALEDAYDANEGENLYPLPWFKSAHNGGDSSKLWGAITNAPIPANGVLLLPFVSGFVASASVSVENIVQKGYANRSTVEEVLAEITGTKAKNFRDGAFARINSQAGAVTATAIQHITSVAQAGVASIFFGRYRWVSVIDNATTEICKSRNNRIFRYGEGPLPPAHIRCRSKTVPVVAGDDSTPPSSYHAWMNSQPESVQNDILGARKASDLRSGKIKAKDMPQFDELNPLSVEGFVSKLNLILTR
jgi:SPP1 gp7 family putative phage head morphogenesis protein